MAKRFTETTKWQDPWFRKLSAENKAVWEYLRDSVDAAGFWKKDYELASFLIGIEVIEPFILDAFNDGKERVKDHGTHLELVDFVFFQYGVLSPLCKAHKHVIDLLEKYKIKGFGNPIQRVKDKDKDKDKDIKGGVGEKELGAWFEKVWVRYPSRDGKKEAIRHFRNSVRSLADFQRLEKSLDNYLAHLALPQNSFKQPKNGKTWFNNWQDWENWQEPERKKDAGDRVSEIIAKIHAQ